MTTYSGPIFHEGAGATIQRQRYTIGHADFTAAATSEAVSVSPALPAGALILGVSDEVTEAFSGGTISAATITVGTNGGGNLDRYVDAFDVFTAAVARRHAIGDGTAISQEIAAPTLDVTLATTGDNVVNADAGVYVFDVWYFAPTANPDDE